MISLSFFVAHFRVSEMIKDDEVIAVSDCF